MNIKYMFWFFLRSIIAYPLFYIGLSLIQIFLMFLYDIRNNIGDYSYLPILLITAIGIIYSFIFYTRDSKKIGIIMIYGGNIFITFLLPFFEMTLFLIISLVIILVTISKITITSILIGLIYVIISSIIICIRSLLIDAYKILKEN